MSNNVKKPWSPYSGSKRSMVEYLRPFISGYDTFVDCCAGTGSVGINSGAESVIFYEINPHLKNVYQHLIAASQSEIYFSVLMGQVNSYSKMDYYELRDMYNSKSLSSLDEACALMCLMHRSYCSLARWNKKGLFNVGEGLKEVNVDNIENFVFALNDIERGASCFSSSITELGSLFSASTDSQVCFYADPPYWIADDAYQSSWAKEKEMALRDMLELADRNGNGVVLSNVMSHRGVNNVGLYNWAVDNGFAVYTMVKKYDNWARSTKGAGTSKSLECIITNSFAVPHGDLVLFGGF